MTVSRAGSSPATSRLNRNTPCDTHTEPAAKRAVRRSTNQVPLFLMLGDAEAANHPGPTGPGSRQPRRQVRVEHEALHQLRLEAAQAHAPTGRRLASGSAAHSQAFTRHIRLAQDLDQLSWPPQAENACSPSLWL